MLISSKFQCVKHLDYTTDSKDEFQNHIKNHKVEDDVLNGEISSVERERKGIELYDNGYVEIIDGEISRVLSESSSSSYLVNHVKKTCKCNDHVYRGKYGIVCKHRIADELARDAVVSTGSISVITFANAV